MDRREDRELEGWLDRGDLKDPYEAKFTIHHSKFNIFCQ